MKSNIHSLITEYWNYEMQLAGLADSLGTTKLDLICKAAHFDLKVREKVLDLLKNQVQLLRSGNESLKIDLVSQTIVDLSEYRQLRL